MELLPEDIEQIFRPVPHEQPSTTVFPLIAHAGGTLAGETYTNSLEALDARPAASRVGASCHDLAQLQKAVDLGLDYVFISPVKATRSHPDQTALGWSRFSALARVATMPVYALGGVGPDDISTAWDAGGQGIAGISAYWGD